MYIGVDKTGKVIGVPDIDGDMLKIKDRLKNNITPSCMGLFDVAAEKMASEDVQYNYVAYLLADVNGTSVKVAKYNGLDRVDLMENNEYGHCSH